MAVFRSYGGRAANIHRDRVVDTCPFCQPCCNACDSLACFGVWILMALIGGGLVVWGSLQLAHESEDTGGHIAAVSCGLALTLVSIVLVVRACSKHVLITFT